MGSFSTLHWVIVLVVVALIFGTKKIASLGTDLGGAIKGFKDGMRETEVAQPPAQEGEAAPAQAVRHTESQS